MIEQTRKFRATRREARQMFEDVSKWELIQLRITPDLKDDIQAWCRYKGLTLSSYLRLVCAKTVEDARMMNDPRQLQPIENAVKGVGEFLPWDRK
jgi:antitoxin component of RelBE/YafQ-DinJ toxin-antitoxin module